jgi:hypothetical protein
MVGQSFQLQRMHSLWPSQRECRCFAAAAAATARPGQHQPARQRRRRQQQQREEEQQQKQQLPTAPNSRLVYIPLGWEAATASGGVDAAHYGRSEHIPMHSGTPQPPLLLPPQPPPSPRLPRRPALRPVVLQQQQQQQQQEEEEEQQQQQRAAADTARHSSDHAAVAAGVVSPALMLLNAPEEHPAAWQRAVQRRLAAAGAMPLVRGAGTVRAARLGRLFKSGGPAVPVGAAATAAALAGSGAGVVMAPGDPPAAPSVPAWADASAELTPHSEAELCATLQVRGCVRKCVCRCTALLHSYYCSPPELLLHGTTCPHTRAPGCV